MKKLLIILLTGILASGCSEFDVDEILLGRSDISVTLRGREIYSFDPNKGQISFNADKGEYRIFDEDFLNWVTIVWSETPMTSGQKLITDIEWGTKTNFKKKEEIEFQVRKIDEEGMVWLWNESDKIGITLKIKYI